MLRFMLSSSMLHVNMSQSQKVMYDVVQKQVAIIINHITSTITTAVVDRNKIMRMI